MHTTLIQVGRLVAGGGALSLGFSPERQWVQLYASDPNDRRKAGVSLVLDQGQYGQLKRLIAELDQVIRANGAERSQAHVGAPREVPGTGQVLVSTSHGNVFVPGVVYEMVSHVASTQSREAARKFLRGNLEALPAEAVDEVLNALLGS